MKNRNALWLCVGVVGFTALAAFAGQGKKAAGPQQHVAVTASALKWKAGPASLPAGIQMAVLSGDPTAEGPFVMRLKIPAGTRIAPHSHPAHEHVTVLAGTFRLAMGDKFDETKLDTFRAGDFTMMPPGHTHFVLVPEESLIQLHGWGPWAINYVNPRDDPRTK